MFNIDLKSRYHHVDIAVHHRKYLGFEWEQRFYVFTVLPFGLASAPYVFTKLLRPLVKLWRSRGLKSLMYLDDGIVAVNGKESAKKASKWVKNSLISAGFVINDAKSVWLPSHRVMWLGFNLDLVKGCVSVPQEKLDELVSLLRESFLSTCLRAKQIASIVGKIISMGIALGPVSRFMTRNLYAMLESRYAWCDVLEVSPHGRMELELTACIITTNNQYGIALQLLEWCTQMQVIQGMVDTLWSMVFMWPRVVGCPRRPYRALLGGSWWQLVECWIPLLPNCVVRELGGSRIIRM